MHSASELHDDLLRPEPVVRESDNRGGVVFIALVFAGLAILAASSSSLREIVNLDAACPVAAVTYCDRQ
jgi:hypothetical protein